MKITLPCPQSVRLNLTTEDANNNPSTGIKITIEERLISFEFLNGDPVRQVESIEDLDANLGLAIADEDRPVMIRALSDLKATVGNLRAAYTRESLYTLKRSETAPTDTAEATDDSSISHLRAKQHASSEGSSEQHGVAPQNEENENVEARKEEQRKPVAAAGGRRKRR